MTSDKIKSALIEYLSGAMNIPVVDGEATDETILPCVAVKITQASRLSLALAKVESITLEVTYREHQGDEDRESMADQSEILSSLIVEPDALKTALNAIIEDGTIIDMIHFAGGSPSWDEGVYQSTFEGECYAQRGTVA